MRGHSGWVNYRCPRMLRVAVLILTAGILDRDDDVRNRRFFSESNAPQVAWFWWKKRSRARRARCWKLRAPSYIIGWLWWKLQAGQGFAKVRLDFEPGLTGTLWGHDELPTESPVNVSASG